MITTVLLSAMLLSPAVGAPAHQDPISECHAMFPGTDSYNRQHEWQCVLDACPWLDPNDPYAGDGWYLCANPGANLGPTARHEPDPVVGGTIVHQTEPPGIRPPHGQQDQREVHLATSTRLTMKDRSGR